MTGKLLRFRTIRVDKSDHIRLPRETRSRRLPWFRCRKCARRLAQIDVVQGRTCVRIGRGVSYRMEITCRQCGAMREFVSAVVL